jgi:hypothetical protein
MVPTMTTLWPRCTGEWAVRLQPDALLAGCREIGSTTGRARGLTPVTTLPLCLWQMLPGPTAGPPLPHVSGWRFRAAAYGHARARRPRHRFTRLLERFGSAGRRAAGDDGRWPGHRPCLGDGSGGARPEPPALPPAFGQSTAQRPGGGVPGARRLGLCPAGPGVLLKRLVAPLLPHDLAQVRAVHPR